MKYMGSKNRIAKDILPLLLEGRKDEWFVDLFCGGCNLLDKVRGKRIGNDLNKYLIALWKGLQEDRPRPLIIEKDIYDDARKDFNNNTNLKFDDFMIGWIGWMGSYNGRFFDGGYSGHNVKGRDYIAEQIKNTEQQIEKLKDVRFFTKNYDEFVFKEPCIIYADKPYQGTKSYATSKNFDHDKFWKWARNISKEGHKLFVSEYNAPHDFECIWSKNLTNSMNTIRTHNAVEKLFTYKLR